MCALVTGVQTCALPILVSIVASFTSASTYLVPPGWSIFVEIVASLTFPIIVAAERKRLLLILLALGVASAFMFAGHLRIGTRSEERRVGKECVSTCRSGWSPVH